MDWDSKVEMVDLMRKSEYDESGTDIFQEYVLDHIKEFDEQAWDMLITNTNLAYQKK